MAQKDFKPTVLLAGPEYKGLTSPQSCVDWLKRWEEALAKKDLLSLTTLLHSGFKVVGNNTGPDAIRVIIHYLGAADGHSKPENFGEHSDGRATIIAKNSRETLREISDQAWREVCNRLFKNDRTNTGEDFANRSAVFQPVVARVMFDFIDRSRWSDYWASNVRTIPGINDAYQEKAVAYAQAYLQRAWQISEAKAEESLSHYFPSKADDVSVTFREARAFYWRERPRMIQLMHNYGILDTLRNKRLDIRTRRKLTKMARQRGGVQQPLLADIPLEVAYGELEPEQHRWHVLSNRTAAEIIILYPHLQRGWREAAKAKAVEARRLKAEHVAELATRAAEAQAALEAARQSRRP